MFNINKKTKVVCLLVVLFLTIMVGYYRNLSISTKKTYPAKIANTPSLKAKTDISNLEKEDKQKQTLPVTSKINCHKIRLKVTKISRLNNHIIFEGFTDPDAIVIVNDLKLKANPKGFFSGEINTNQQEKLVIKAFSQDGDVATCIYCSNCL